MAAVVSSRSGSKKEHAELLRLKQAPNARTCFLPTGRLALSRRATQAGLYLYAVHTCTFVTDGIPKTADKSPRYIKTE
ncbi:hypothetical protein QE152_g38205 [Popillia japonica]|uniref:Uncharacterized protein n=1 Tax=Popillia japonica TaxID=7064 RepID=A0AAW1I7J5_POPJA